MFHNAVALPCCNTIIMAAQRPQKQQRRATKKSKLEKKQSRKSNETRVGFGNDKTELQWQCVELCSPCCKLDKGPAFATPKEIFDDPFDIHSIPNRPEKLYRSLMGPDGWCINYDKTTRKCSIYSDRPYFCRVEPGVFESLYEIDKKKFNKEACGCCRDTIKAIYGTDSEELDNFNRSIRSSSSELSRFCDVLKKKN